MSGAAGKHEAPVPHVGPMGTQNMNAMVVSPDVSCFTDLDEQKAGVDAVIDSLKALPTASGFKETVMPCGMGERRCAERMRTGIPVPGGTVASLRNPAERLGVELPPHLV